MLLTWAPRLANPFVANGPASTREESSTFKCYVQKTEQPTVPLPQGSRQQAVGAPQVEYVAHRQQVAKSALAELD